MEGAKFDVLEKMFSRNAEWAQNLNRQDPDFFPETARGVSPKVLWIGCADARVPESVITGSRPGEIVVQRNVANQFHATDNNAQAILEFAIETLRVEHIVVAGHTDCGGATACLEAASSPASSSQPDPLSPLKRWLVPLTSLARSLHASSTTSSPLTLTTLVEENVKAQVAKLCEADVVSKAWGEGKEDEGVNRRQLWIHGWVYQVESGLIRDLGVSRSC